MLCDQDDAANRYSDEQLLQYLLDSGVLTLADFR